MDTESNDMRSLVMLLGKDVLSDEQRRVEYSFQNIVNMAHRAELFDWMLDGKESEGDYVLKPGCEIEVWEAAQEIRALCRR